MGDYWVSTTSPQLTLPFRSLLGICPLACGCNRGGKSPTCRDYCGSCLTSGTRGVGPNHACIFPFEYVGKWYDRCLLSHGMQSYAWCSTAVSASGSYIDGEWGECGSECPGAVTSGTVSDCLTSGIIGVGSGYPC